MQFNIFRDFYTQSVNVTAIPPIWRDSDVVPVNCPARPVKKLGATVDYSIIMRYINEIKKSIYDNDLFFLRCSAARFRYWLQKLWMLYSEKYDNFLLKAPLTIADRDFPTLQLNSDVWTSKKIILSVKNDELQDWQDYNIVCVACDYNFMTKKPKVSIISGSVVGVEVGYIDDVGVPRFSYNQVYLINNYDYDISCTYTKYFSLEYVAGDWFNISVCDCFSERVSQNLLASKDDQAVPLSSVLKSIATQLINILYKNYNKLLAGSPFRRLPSYTPFTNRSDWLDYVNYQLEMWDYKSYFEFACLRLYAPTSNIIYYAYRWTIPRSPRLWIYISFSGFLTVSTDEYVFIPIVLQGKGSAITASVSTPQVFPCSRNSWYPVEVGILADELNNNKHVITRRLFVLCYAFKGGDVVDYSTQVAFYVNFDGSYSVVTRKDDFTYNIEKQYKINTNVSYKADQLLKFIYGAGRHGDFFMDQNGAGLNMFDQVAASNEKWLLRTNINNNLMIIGNVQSYKGAGFTYNVNIKAGTFSIRVDTSQYSDNENFYFCAMVNVPYKNLTWSSFRYITKSYIKGQNVIFDNIDYYDKRLLILITCYSIDGNNSGSGYKTYRTFGLYIKALDTGGGYLQVIDVTTNKVGLQVYIDKIY